MIITKFNDYFDKHGKVTYLVLCIIISVIFVFTFGSTDLGCSGGRQRLETVGTMYGKDIETDAILRKGRQIRLMAALNNQRYSTRENTYELIVEALRKQRLVHHGEELKLDNVTKEDIVKAVVDLPYWKISDKDRTGNELESTDTYYSTTRFKRFLNETVKNQFGLTGEDFDDMMRDDIIAKRVEENAVKDLKVDEKTVNTIAADSMISTLAIPMSLEADSKPADAEIDAFLKDRASELTDKDMMKDYYLVAFATEEDLEKAAKNKPEIAKAMEVSDAEIQKFFDDNKAVLFKDKAVADVKEQIVKQLKSTKTTDFVNANLKTVVDAMALPLPEKSTRFQQFIDVTRKAGLRIARQNGLPEGSFVNGVELQQQNLVNAIKELKDLDKPTAIIPLNGDNGEDGAAVAVKVENPNKQQNMRNAATRIIRGEKALVLWKEKVEKVYAAKVAAAASFEDFVAQEAGYDKMDPMAPAACADIVAKRNELNDMMAPFITSVEGKTTLETPKATDDSLISWYKRQLAREAALKRANEKLEAAKKDAKIIETFKANDKKLNWYSALNSAQQMMFQQMYARQGKVTPELLREIQFYSYTMAASNMGISTTNLPELFAELDKIGDKALVAKPIPTASGYLLVYQISRALPTEEADKAQVENTRSMLLNNLKQKTLSDLYSKLETESNTQLREEIIPRKEDEAK